MFPTAMDFKTKNIGDPKFGQDGPIGYHAFGSSAGTLFITTKEKDVLKISQKYGAAMASIVTSHSLPFLPAPVFADVIEALAIGEGIAAPAVYDEFRDHLGTPAMAKSALVATRSPVAGSVAVTPLHAFGSSVTEATDESLVRAQHLNTFNRMVADVQAHNRYVWCLLF